METLNSTGYMTSEGVSDVIDIYIHWKTLIYTYWIPDMSKEYYRCNGKIRVYK